LSSFSRELPDFVVVNIGGVCVTGVDNLRVGPSAVGVVQSVEKLNDFDVGDVLDPHFTGENGRIRVIGVSFSLDGNVRGLVGVGIEINGRSLL
jgi:hypothetical protein